MKSLELKGFKVGRLSVIDNTDGISSNGSKLWRCICECGKECIYAANVLNSGRITQCWECGLKYKSRKGAIPLDLTNCRFSKLLALYRTNNKSPDGSFIWMCRCDCGSNVEVASTILRKGYKNMCDVCRIENIRLGKISHNMSTTNTYKSWIGMKDRVTNKNHIHYKNYGGRGITIYEKWINSFENFYKDVGDRPSLKHTLDRIDNDGNYEPGNVKWSTKKEQMRNRRNTIFLSYEGVVKSIDDWCEQLNIKKHLVYSKIRSGWDKEKILQLYVNKHFS